jgi:hypothetical protein
MFTLITLSNTASECPSTDRNTVDRRATRMSLTEALFRSPTRHQPAAFADVRRDRDRSARRLPDPHY